MINSISACILIYLLAWVAILSLPLFERPVKQSEKSLMVNGASPTIPPDTIQESKAFENHMWLHPGANLSQMLDSIGMDSYWEREDNGCGFMHGILRSPRGDGKESIILVTPVSLTLPSQSSTLLVRSGLILVGHLSSVQWLAKDFIWLIVFSNGLHCSSTSILGGWLDQYQNGKGARPHFIRAGVLQQGLVLTAQDGDSGPSTMDINLVGYNSLLPKLDMYHLIKANAWVLSRLNIILDPSDLYPTALSGLPRHFMKVKHMSRMILQSMSCKPTGDHAEFKRFMVDAANLHLTLDPSLTSGEGSNMAALKIAEFLELAFRSLNNLSERMHHSYFLYLLTSPSTFVTVEFYIIPVILLILIPAAQAVTSVIELNSLQLDGDSRGIEHWVSSVFCALLSSAASLFFRLFAYDYLSDLLPDTLSLSLAASLVPLMATKACISFVDCQRVIQLKLKVVTFSLAVAALSALACINPWLSFATSAALVAPLSVAWVWERSISAILRLFILTAACPPVIMSFYQSMFRGDSTSIGQAVSNAELVMFGLATPFWALCFHSSLHHQRD